MDNLYGLFRQRFPSRLSRPFLETERGEVYRYEDVERTTARFARGLNRLGLDKGDRLVAQIDKSPAAVFLYLACLRSGIIYVPLNTAYQAAELDHFLADAEPRTVICRPESFERMALLCQRRGLTAPLALDVDGRGSFADGLTTDDVAYRDAEVDAGEVAALLYTSGTTGRPKAAMMTHGQLWAKADAIARWWGWTDADVLLHAMPIFHTHGLFLSMHCVLATGSSMLFLPRFEPESILRLLPRATTFTAVPTMYGRLLASLRLTAEVCRNMRLFISGSAPLSPKTFHGFEERTRHTILECWGMTETLTNASNPLAGKRRAGTVGRPVPGVELRVADEDGCPRPSGEASVLEVRTAPAFAGYWRRPEETRAAFRPDGFFVTGDVGRFGEDGYLRIVGRASDMIISGGYNVYPKEVEAAIDRVAGVAASAVLGVPHRDFGEAVIAVVERGAAPVPADQEILGRLKGELASFKVPKKVFWVEALPRNDIGKVQKHLLRERYRHTFSDAGQADSA